jgi:hypothetical protein
VSNPSNQFSELPLLDQLIFIPLGLKLSDVEIEPESGDYFAHTFILNNTPLKFRKAKITPTKIGQFVTLWKRDKFGTTQPHSITDNYEFYIIATKRDINFGIFIFPKTLLQEKGVLSNDKKEGKRGIRVYPIWDVTTNKQAQQTQEWQVNYFFQQMPNGNFDLKKIKKMLELVVV